MAAPLARLTMSDSSDEEIVVVFVSVAVIGYNQEATKVTDKEGLLYTVRFATTNIWGLSWFGTRDGNRRPKEARPG